jgi:hypothetical protein
MLSESWGGPMARHVKPISRIADYYYHGSARWLILSLAGVAQLLAGVVQPPAQMPPAAATEPASLSGVVTNTVTGAPVLRAHVSIRNSGGLEQEYGAITNGEGKFTMTQLPPGHYTVSVERAGFVMSRNPPGTSFTDVKLSPGDKKENFKLTLVPTGAINGRAFDAAGEPMQGVGVTAEGGSGGANATTDDQGQFRVGGLQPGKYRVKASPQAMPLPPETHTDGTTEVHYSPTYYPDSLAEKQAARVEVQPAAELTGIDIHLVRTPIVSVSGKVSGLPPGSRNVSIDVQPTSGMGGSSQSGSIVKPDGSFAIWRLDPGKYSLVAAIWGQDGRNRLQSAPVEIEVAGVNLEHIDMRMIPPFDIPVQLHFEDDQARQVPQLPAQPGQPPPPAPTRRVSLGLLIGAQMPMFAEIEAGDSATLEKAQPGLYHLAISWRPAYVKSIRIGSVETEGDTLDVRNGLVGPVTVVVSSNACEVSGTVSGSQETAPGVQVALVRPMEYGRPDLNLVTTGAGGTYKFAGVPPGKYKLLVVEDDVLSVIMRGQGTEDYEDIAESLDLHAGDKIVKDLKQRK